MDIKSIQFDEAAVVELEKDGATVTMLVENAGDAHQPDGISFLFEFQDVEIALGGDEDQDAFTTIGNFGTIINMSLGHNESEFLIEWRNVSDESSTYVMYYLKYGSLDVVRVMGP